MAIKAYATSIASFVYHGPERVLAEKVLLADLKIYVGLMENVDEVHPEHLADIYKKGARINGSGFAVKINGKFEKTESATEFNQLDGAFVISGENLATTPSLREHPQQLYSALAFIHKQPANSASQRCDEAAKKIISQFNKSTGEEAVFHFFGAPFLIFNAILVLKKNLSPVIALALKVTAAALGVIYVVTLYRLYQFVKLRDEYSGVTLGDTVGRIRRWIYKYPELVKNPWLHAKTYLMPNEVAYLSKR